MTTQVNLAEYELCDFTNKIANKRTRGLRVGNWLIVSYADLIRQQDWRIYRADGRPFIETTWVTNADALQAAEWLDSVYKDFFFILEDYPTAELWHLTHLTVENGVLYRDVIEAIKDQKRLRWADVERLIH